MSFIAGSPLTPEHLLPHWALNPRSPTWTAVGPVVSVIVVSQRLLLLRFLDDRDPPTWHPTHRYRQPMRFLESDADLAQRRRMARRAMRPMRLKMRRGEPLTDDEQKAWDDGLQVLAKIGADKSRLRRARALPPTKETTRSQGLRGVPRAPR